MVNLIAGEELVPELVQDDFTADQVVSRIQEILPDGVARDRMLEGMARVKKLLRGPDPDSLSPAEVAADLILRVAALQLRL